MAASVSTRVVSWNDAADSHESVASDALVMPISSGRPSAGRSPSSTSALVGLAEHLLVDPLAGQEVGVARLLHADAAGHLPHDQLDVLVVDRHALVAVHLLDLVDEVQLGLADALDLEELLRVDGALDERARRRWTSWPSATSRRAEDRHRRSSSVPSSATIVTARPLPSSSRCAPRRTSGPAGGALGAAGLEQLDHAGQTAGDVLTGHATGVEGPHRQLRAGLADRLGGDDADRLAELDRVAGGQRAAVAEAADAELGVAGEHRAHPHPVRPAGRRASAVDLVVAEDGVGRR